MQFRRFGRMGWDVSEIGFGAWAIGGMWGDQDDNDSLAALHKYIELGGNFIDTAQAYGDGRSESLVAKAIKEHGDRIYVATKLPPKNRIWNPPSGMPWDEAFPVDYLIEGVEFSLKNLQTDCIDVYQLHTWCETWNGVDEIYSAAEKLKKDGKIRAFGISTTENFPEQVIPALQSGVVDSLQVIFNLFEQHPAYTILPHCKDNDIFVIVRVPFDEAALTGKFTGNEVFAEDDFRSRYFRGDNLKATVQRVEQIKEWAKTNTPDMSMPELALRFTLSHDQTGSVIPGIRNTRHAELNTAPSDGKRLTDAQIKDLMKFAWRRNPWVENLLTLEKIRTGGIQ
ncbi:MAG: aldo/keto reductase [Candidatus Hinthialibacter antarcticus]|nr:aldo/keto reductase [Candidatus Hinthialibacter antarcticus]